MDFVAETWNGLLPGESGAASKGGNQLLPQPRLLHVDSREEIGLVSSDYISSFGGLLTIKDEEDLEDVNLEMPLHENVAEDDVIHTLGIDPSSLLVPEQPQPTFQVPHTSPTSRKDGGTSQPQSVSTSGQQHLTAAEMSRGVETIVSILTE